MSNEAATAIVAILAVPGVQRLLEAVAVWIEIRARRGAEKQASEPVTSIEGGNEDDD